jgi:hypothetical protein
MVSKPNYFQRVTKRGHRNRRSLNLTVAVANKEGFPSVNEISKWDPAQMKELSVNVKRRFILFRENLEAKHFT